MANAARDIESLSSESPGPALPVRHRSEDQISVRVRHAFGQYIIVIASGLLERAASLLAGVVPARRVIIVTDTTVSDLYLQKLQSSLEAQHFKYDVLVIAPGERSKDFHTYQVLVEGIAALCPDRQTAIVALGGGVVGDLAGFAAATTMRGLQFVQIPTTLLSQVDSSVGGKTGINLSAGKNLLGAFHQPSLVLIDPTTLSTLPIREARAGYAEIVKAGLISDPDFFAWCEMKGTSVVEGDPDAQISAIERACRFKSRVVAEDETENNPTGGRALLNLGHTFGHAIETQAGYAGTILHGEAVAIGCQLAFSLSVDLGLCPQRDLDRLRVHLTEVGLPLDMSALPLPISSAAMLATMDHDKKASQGRPTLVLAKGIGKAFLARDVPRERIMGVLESHGARD